MFMCPAFIDKPIHNGVSEH